MTRGCVVINRSCVLRDCAGLVIFGDNDPELLLDLSVNILERTTVEG